MEEYVRIQKARDLYEQWEIANSAALNEKQNGFANDMAHLSKIEENDKFVVDKNVIRKRILDTLGRRLEDLNQIRDTSYFLKTIYDPLTSNMYQKIEK